MFFFAKEPTHPTYSILQSLFLFCCFCFYACHDKYLFPSHGKSQSSINTTGPQKSIDLFQAPGNTYSRHQVALDDQERRINCKIAFIYSIIHRTTCLNHEEMLKSQSPLLIISWSVFPLELCYLHSFSFEKYLYILNYLLQ